MKKKETQEPRTDKKKRRRRKCRTTPSFARHLKIGVGPCKEWGSWNLWTLAFSKVYAGVAPAQDRSSVPFRVCALQYFLPLHTQGFYWTHLGLQSVLGSSLTLSRLPRS